MDGIKQDQLEYYPSCWQTKTLVWHLVATFLLRTAHDIATTPVIFGIASDGYLFQYHRDSYESPSYEVTSESQKMLQNTMTL